MYYSLLGKYYIGFYVKNQIDFRMGFYREYRLWNKF